MSCIFRRWHGDNNKPWGSQLFPRISRKFWQYYASRVEFSRIFTSIFMHVLRINTSLKNEPIRNRGILFPQFYHLILMLNMPRTKTAEEEKFTLLGVPGEFFKVFTRIHVHSDSSRACWWAETNQEKKMRREKSFYDSMRHTNHGIAFTVRKFSTAACRF